MGKAKKKADSMIGNLSFLVPRLRLELRTP